MSEFADVRSLYTHLVHGLGLRVTLTRAGRVSIKPKKRVTTEITRLLIAHQAELEAMLREEHAVPAREAGDVRPECDADVEDLKLAARDVWGIIHAVNEPTLFRRGGLAWLEPDDDKTRLIVKQVDTARLRHWLTQRVRFVKRTPFGPAPTTPAGVLLGEILATPDPPVPVITRVISCPVFAADGTLHERPGYDARTRCWLELPPGFTLLRVSASPNAEERARARELLFEPFADFPFVSDADRAHVVAVILTIFARELFSGPSPLCVFTKPAPGTGATLAAKIAILIALGAEPPVITQAHEEPEWRKRITSLLLRGPAAILVDNLRGMIDSAALSAVLTTIEWQDRTLGKNEDVILPNRAAWLATANNAILSTELARRSVRVKFDAQSEKPWRDEREFRHPELAEWVRANRADLVHAGLTLIAAWIDAGRPAGAKTLASYESWAKTIGGILAVAEIAGFLGNLDELYEEQDVETDDVKRFLSAWWAGHGDAPMTTSELAAIATHPSVALPIGGKDDSGRAVSLGHWLKRYRGRPYDLDAAGTVVVTKQADSRSGQLWKLAKPMPKRTGVAGVADFLPTSCAGNMDLNGQEVRLQKSPEGEDRQHQQLRHAEGCDCHECVPLTMKPGF